MAASAVPPARLPPATCAEVREVLLAELIAAGHRARAAGCSPESLFEVLDRRLSSAAEDGQVCRCEPDAVGGQTGRRKLAAEAGRCEPDPVGDFWPSRCAPPRSVVDSGLVGRREPDFVREVCPHRCGPPCPAGDGGQLCRCEPDLVGGARPRRSAPPRSVAAGGPAVRREPDFVGDARPAPPCCSTVEDRQDLPHDPGHSRLVGEGRG